MHTVRVNTDRRLLFDCCHVRMMYLMLMTSAAYVMVCYAATHATLLKSKRKISLMPIDFRPHYTQLYQVEKLKAQILRGLNLTSVPEPPTKKPPQHIWILNRVPVPSNTPHLSPSAMVWSEPVDMRKKSADRLLFRIANQRKKSVSINRVSLLLRLRSSRHSKRKHRKKKPKAKRNHRPKLPELEAKDVQNDQPKRSNRKQSKAKRNHRPKLPELEAKDVQNDQPKRSHRKQSSSRRKKNGSRARGRKSRRVKVLVQTMNSKSGKFKRVAVQRVVVDKRFHWVNLPIPASLVSRAVQSSNQSLVLRVRCKRCHKGGVSIDSAVPRKKSRLKAAGAAPLNPNRPYLVIFVNRTGVASAPAKTPSRSARHVAALRPVRPSRDNMSCCAQRLHVSFRELGWDHWIVEPAGFSTVLCRGVCQEPSEAGVGPPKEDRVSSSAWKEAASDSGQHGGQLLPHEHQAWALRRKSASDSGDGDSCQPQDPAPLAVTYYTDRSTLTHAVIPELVFNRCSCGKK